jgi:hypothetical protein
MTCTISLCLVHFLLKSISKLCHEQFSLLRLLESWRLAAWVLNRFNRFLFSCYFSAKLEMNECGTTISWICYDACYEVIVLLFNKVLFSYVEDKFCMGFFSFPLYN